MTESAAAPTSAASMQCSEVKWSMVNGKAAQKQHIRTSKKKKIKGETVSLSSLTKKVIWFCLWFAAIDSGTDGEKSRSQQHQPNQTHRPRDGRKWCSIKQLRQNTHTRTPQRPLWSDDRYRRSTMPRQLKLHFFLVRQSWSEELRSRKAAKRVNGSLALLGDTALHRSFETEPNHPLPESVRNVCV